MEGNLNSIFVPGSVAVNIKILKAIFIILSTYITNFKIVNRKIKLNFKIMYTILFVIFISIICAVMKYKINFLINVISTILLISIVFSKDNIKNSIMVTATSLSINYIISFITIVINFIFLKLVPISNNYINLMIMTLLHIILLGSLFRIKKFRYGFSFFKNDQKNEYMDIFILNISVTILFSTIIFAKSNIHGAVNTVVCLTTFGVIMFFTIQKSLQLYYKQKLLEQELSTVKEELANKTKEIENLEAENVEISKKSHTLSHKQKALEYKLEEMMMNAEISQEEVGEVRDRLKAIGKDLYKEKTAIELDKTGISKIDDMLKYLQSECKKNKIDFELQIKGNIHYMTNNLISAEDLETLLADHIKNAIIAINHTDNINKSILVRLGEIDGIYSLYIYDSGIEFEKETLENIGKKPSTTHADEGGTGMGFMNTFDTLRKCKASLAINEIGEPSKDNYTKAIIIKFDSKNEFKIVSYRK